jgi:hypothetical protein
MPLIVLMVLTLLIMLFVIWKVITKRRIDRNAMQMQEVMEDLLDQALHINVEMLSLGWDKFEEIATKILNDPDSPRILCADARAVISACSEIRTFVDSESTASSSDEFLTLHAKVKQAVATLADRCDSLAEEEEEDWVEEA